MKRILIFLAKFVACVLVAGTVYYFMGDPINFKEEPTVTALLDSNRCPTLMGDLSVNILNDTNKIVNSFQIEVVFGEKGYSGRRGNPVRISSDKILKPGESFMVCEDSNISWTQIDRSQVQVYPKLTRVLFAD